MTIIGILLMQNIVQNLSVIPKILRQPSKKQHYGTAGYRGPAETLESTVGRAALAASLEAAACGQFIGIMLTASHNHYTHNGVKIIDSNGFYMNSNFERLCDELVNSPDDDFLDMFLSHAKNLGDKLPNAKILIGRDTRESGSYLEQVILQALNYVNVEGQSVGCVTTPQLHWLVRASNQHNTIVDPDAYVTHLVRSYDRLVGLWKNDEQPVSVDTAHGVGALIINSLIHRLPNKMIKIINAPGQSHLFQKKFENFRSEGKKTTQSAQTAYNLSSTAGDNSKFMKPSLLSHSKTDVTDQIKLAELQQGNVPHIDSESLDTVQGKHSCTSPIDKTVDQQNISVCENEPTKPVYHSIDSNSVSSEKTSYIEGKHMSPISRVDARIDWPQTEEDMCSPIHKLEKHVIASTGNSVGVDHKPGTRTCFHTSKESCSEGHHESDYRGRAKQNEDDFRAMKSRENRVTAFIPDPLLLNEKCGADYIVTFRKPPANLCPNAGILRRVAAFDGDADRLVYFAIDPEFTLIDGDRLAVGIANFIHVLTRNIGTFSVGMVLSHYSNSAALKSVSPEIKTVLAQTGVKHFVEAANMFDIGIFFEPNGHGSVTFSKECISKLEKTAATADLPRETIQKADILLALSNLFDPCVGDAVANFLIIEAIMDNTAWRSLAERYRNLPTRMLTVRVKDKNVIKTIRDVEIISPVDLRNRLEQLCKAHRGRAFVRPSGTEDVIRVFAESHTAEDADSLCVRVAQAVYDICDGIGNHPEINY